MHIYCSVLLAPSPTASPANTGSEVLQFLADCAQVLDAMQYAVENCDPSNATTLVVLLETAQVAITETETGQSKLTEITQLLNQ